jgi:hypothetical protein
VYKAATVVTVGLASLVILPGQELLMLVVEVEPVVALMVLVGQAVGAME